MILIESFVISDYWRKYLIFRSTIIDGFDVFSGNSSGSSFLKPASPSICDWK